MKVGRMHLFFSIIASYFEREPQSVSHWVGIVQINLSCRAAQANMQTTEKMNKSENMLSTFSLTNRR